MAMPRALVDASMSVWSVVGLKLPLVVVKLILMPTSTGSPRVNPLAVMVA